jgi:tRNA-Thr(GGU) m(6)t(6)A37 methyltransferase TsaA
MKFTYQPIGFIYSPYKKLEGMPIQPSGATGVQGHIEILPEFVDGLADVDGFSHIIILYALHMANKVKLTVTPFLDPNPRGVFATRAPTRPNPIGLSIVKLLSIKGNKIQIENIDVLNGTPLLDIKPYVPEFDQYPEVRVGWLEEVKGRVAKTSADKRFE